MKIMRLFLVILLSVFFTFSLFSQEERKVIREGNDFYKEGDFDNAISRFTKVYEDYPEKIDLLNNIGASEYRNGMFNESAMTYSDLLDIAGTKEEKANAFYNIGNSYLQAADYENSIKAYQNALRMDPNHDLSRYNMAVATKIQEQQQQQQDQQQQNDGDGDSQDNQDKQDKEEGNNDKEDQQNKDEQENNEEKEDKQQKPEPKEGEMSREEMERFLESLQQQEKDIQEKVEREKFKSQQRIVEKEW